MKQRWCVVVAMAMAATSGASGCGFDGGKGRAMEPDGGIIDEAPDVGVDAPMLPVITCEGFLLIAGSHYKLLPDPANRADAKTRCAALTGGRLATFETVTEPNLVATGVGLTNATPAWTGVEQRPMQASGAGDNWFNVIGDDATPIPVSFPWRVDEPNDFDPPEDNEENFGELHMPGVFDDAPADRMSRPLCECTLRPGI